MKKSLIVMASLILGGAVLTAAPVKPPKPARESRDMRQYGPVTVLSTGHEDHAVKARDVLVLSRVGTKMLARITTAGAYNQKNKTVTNRIKLQNNEVPSGYLANGDTTGTGTWSWSDVVAGGVKILGFSGRTVFVELNFGAYIRIYAYQLGTTRKDRTSGRYENIRSAKVVGSTSNILVTDYVQATSDGRSVWLEAANSTWDKDDEVQMFNKKLNGLYKTNTPGDYSRVRVYLGRTEFDVDATTTAITLPVAREIYNYQETPNGADTDITIYR